MVSSIKKLKKLIKMSEKTHNYHMENVDYYSMASNFLELSNIRYVVFNYKEKITAGEDACDLDSASYEVFDIVIKDRKAGEFIVYPFAGEEIKDKEILTMYAMQISSVLERLEYEKTLKINEQKSQNFMEYSPFGMFIVDFEKALVIDANKMASDMSGYAYEELIEKSPQDLFPITSKEKIDQHLKKVLSFGRHEIEMEFIKKNQELIFVEITGVKLTDTKIIGFVKDITEEKIIEEELKHMNLMKNTLLDNTNQLFFLVDKNLRIIDYNKTAQRVAKDFYNADIYIGTPISIFKEHIKEDFYQELLSRAFMGEKIKEEILISNLQGEEVNLEINLNPVIDEKTGEIWAITYTSYNITELKNIEKALRKSEERFKLAAVSTSDIIYELDLESNEITWFNNEDKLESLGLPFFPNNLKEWITFIHPEDRDHLIQFTKKDWKERKPYSGEYRIIDKENKIIYVEDYSVGLYDENNVLTKVVGAITNISGRKYYEEQLKFLSYYDQLTEVNNRGFFEEKLGSLQEKGISPVSIIVIDLDGLKLINDTLGHYKGDIQLKNTANILKESAGVENFVARTGGDEFAVVLPGRGEAEAEKIVTSINQNIELFNQGEEAIPISISSGFSVSHDNATLEEVFKRADDLMYRNKLSKGNSAKSQIISSLMATLAERDYITEGHASRLAQICINMGKNMNLSSQIINNLYLLAKVHDLGKVGIPDNILFKPSSLNDEEWEIMKLHPEKGFRIAISSPDLTGIADLILKHHERWDGNGYPLGIAKKEIPLECRILSVADTFDAITNERPYSKACSKEEAISEIIRCSGSQFDPEIVKVFLEII